MRIENKNSYEIAPEYIGIAKIVGTTELKTYTNSFGEKEKFRYILEFPIKNKYGKKNHTIATKPMTPSLHEKSALFAFIKSVTGKAPDASFETESLIGSYVDVVIQHSEVGDNTYANIISVRQPKKVSAFEQTYEMPFSSDPVPLAQTKVEPLPLINKSKVTAPSDYANDENDESEIPQHNEKVEITEEEKQAFANLFGEGKQKTLPPFKSKL